MEFRDRVQMLEAQKCMYFYTLFLLAEMEAPSDAENSVMIRGLLNMAQSSYHEIQQEVDLAWFCVRVRAVSAT